MCPEFHPLRHRRDYECLSISDEARSFIVHQRSVLDYANAVLDTPSCGVCRMTVSKGVRTLLCGLLNDGANLAFAKLLHPNWIGGGDDAARGHDLNTMRTATKLFASRFDTFIDTVDHAA